MEVVVLDSVCAPKWVKHRRIVAGSEHALGFNEEQGVDIWGGIVSTCHFKSQGHKSPGCFGAKVLFVECVFEDVVGFFGGRGCLVANVFVEHIRHIVGQVVVRIGRGY